MGRGVLMGKTLCIVGAAVAAGVGSAALAVGEKEPPGGVDSPFKPLPQQATESLLLTPQVW